MLKTLAALLVLASTASAQIARPETPPDRERVREALVKRRAHNLESFHVYVGGGIYPHNTYREGPLNVWYDAEGHYCAAATMIWMDGKMDLATKTGQETNNLRLLDVTSGPLLDWMLTSGLTIEEIDRIQEPGFMQQVHTVQTYNAEDKKLLVKYRATERFLKAHAKADLDLATDRLMKFPQLAWDLVDGETPPNS